VLASRLLAVAGGFFVIRLLLFSHEERVPVILIGAAGEAGSGEDTLGSRLRSVTDLRGRGYEIIPLADVVMFVREHRYVPKKCFAVLVETCSREDLDQVLRAAGDTELTVVLPLRLLESQGSELAPHGLPESVTLGTIFTVPEDAAAIEQSIDRYLRDFTDLAVQSLGKKPEFALVEGCSHADLRPILRSSGYTCFLDGSGFNRFGDEGHLLRLIDVSSLLGRGAARGLRVVLYMTMFKGTYFVWPLAAIWHLLEARRKGG
jgi:hypothetical protein